MSNTSRVQVTITLGRDAQVVKRSGSTVDSSFADSQPAVGSKRSVRDRLGSNVDLSLQVNKRMRGNGSLLMVWMLLRSTSKQKDTGLRYPELRYSRQHFQERNDGRQLTSVTIDSRLHRPEARDQYMPDPREPRAAETRESKHGIRDARCQILEPRSSSINVHMPTRTANDVPKVDSVINSYSPWTMDRLRGRSPGEFLVSSQGLSPPTRDEELRRRLPVRTYDDVGMRTYKSKDFFNFSSSDNFSPLMMKVVPSAGPSKTLTRLVAPHTLPGSDLPRSSYALQTT
ncbi:unnamed protein product [Fraxinus pennsylvanica]|uniref:Uncharacterized protein n=1 Tax=Fraxinus pennsylvanica TaxID=56036 RepID=A0AAD1ZY15_9LAMI|nr:unnamed protein product [Fraxinus pennsylvanica]